MNGIDGCSVASVGSGRLSPNAVSGGVSPPKTARENRRLGPSCALAGVSHHAIARSRARNSRGVWPLAHKDRSGCGAVSSPGPARQLSRKDRELIGERLQGLHAVAKPSLPLVAHTESKEDRDQTRLNGRSRSECVGEKHLLDEWQRDRRTTEATQERAPIQGASEKRDHGAEISLNSGLVAIAWANANALPPEARASSAR